MTRCYHRDFRLPNYRIGDRLQRTFEIFPVHCDNSTVHRCTRRVPSGARAMSVTNGPAVDPPHPVSSTKASARDLIEGFPCWERRGAAEEEEAAAGEALRPRAEEAEEGEAGAPAAASVVGPRPQRPSALG